MRIVDDPGEQSHYAVTTVDDSSRPEIGGFHRGRDRDNFKHRSGFKRCDNGQILAPLRLLARVQTLVRIISRKVRKREHFTGPGVHRDEASMIGVVLYHRLLKGVFGDVLHLAVDGQSDVAARERRLRKFRVIGPAFDIDLYAQESRSSSQILIELEFHTAGA